MLLRVCALENRCYVVGCNCIGYDDLCGADYCGRSMVCDWEGKVIEDARVFEAGCKWGFDTDDVVNSVKEKQRAWCMNE